LSANPHTAEKFFKKSFHEKCTLSFYGVFNPLISICPVVKDFYMKTGNLNSLDRDDAMKIATQIMTHQKRIFDNI
jgi:hypothetical protein